jgi:hypothetical protein
MERIEALEKHQEDDGDRSQSECDRDARNEHEKSDDENDPTL